MIGLTASDLSLLESLEKRLGTEVSVGLLADLERELLRLRAETNRREWQQFCAHFSERPVFQILGLADLREQRLDRLMAAGFPARQTALPSPRHVVSAWEYSLPMSRGLRARKVHMASEIAELIRSSVKPRILALGGGRLSEADEALKSGHLHGLQLVALGLQPEEGEYLRKHYAVNCQRKQLQIEEGGWESLQDVGDFELIYAPSLMDSTDDCQAAMWLEKAVECLRPGGRLLTANFRPGSREAGWIEACWNWHLHYRSEGELVELVVKLKCPAMRGHALFQDETGISTFLEIHAL